MEIKQIELQIQATPTRLSQEKIFSFINDSEIVFICIANSIAKVIILFVSTCLSHRKIFLCDYFKSVSIIGTIPNFRSLFVLIYAIFDFVF